MNVSHAPGDNVSANPNTICDRCASLVDSLKALLQKPESTDFLRSPDFGPYTVSSTQEAGLKGCHICSIISQGLCPAHASTEVRTLPQTITMHLSRPGTPPTNGGPLAFITAKLEEAGRVLIPNQTFFIEATSEPKQILPASWSLSTGSEVTFDLARTWLNCCLSEHPICEEVRRAPASRSTSVSPSYLVQINPKSLRLCATKELSETPTFITLSHRWGGAHIFRLLSENRDDLLRNIDPGSLPKTFQDAILITRKLGYQYLWIDSLCIIQDSKEHWQTESAIMGDIYRGSVCTIAALGGIDGDSGCFKTRNPLCFQQYTFDFKHEGQTLFMPPSKERRILEHTGYGPFVEPLHERAWVMQERILSPRTLLYGTFGIYWECVQGNVSSCTSTEMRTSTPGSKYAIHEACNLKLTGQVDATYTAFWRWWVRVITMYNPCGLTFGSDKLVAVAGLVRLVEWRTGLHNIAGLWKEYLLPELLWHVESPQVRPSTYQAPTWSWASFNCSIVAGIQDFAYTFDWKTELLEAVADLAAPNGQLASATIRVCGPLQRVHWIAEEDDGEIYGYKLRWGTEVSKENSADDAVSFMPDTIPDPDAEIWAFLVVHATSPTAWMNMGLVISKAETGDNYVRIGAFRQYDWPDSTTSFFGEGLAERSTLVIQ